MAHVTFTPPYVRADEITSHLRSEGYAVVRPADVAAWVGCPLGALQALSSDWADLPPDEFLKDGGRYRRRRHSCFVADGQDLQQVPHRAHWQPVEYNALHGGMQRWFAPMSDATVSQPAWRQLMTALAQVSQGALAAGVPRWFIEAHQFRIDTTDGIGRPTPEGAHRDGVDLVAVFLVAREGVKGGETRIFEAAGPSGQRFTLSEPWSLLLLDDARMIHETTPIQPLAAGGYRDTLVVTCRRSGFQDAIGNPS
jgi:hypothetical protein